MYLICWSQHLSVTLSVTNQKNWLKTQHNMILTNVHFVQITGFYVIFAFCWLLFFPSSSSWLLSVAAAAAAIIIIFIVVVVFSFNT